MGKLLGYVPFSPGRAAPLVAALAVAWSGLVGVAPAEAVDPVLVAAGDIAGCGPSATRPPPPWSPAAVEGTVATFGRQRLRGRHGAAEFANCYGPSWGRHKARTRPAPGNHEYQTAGAAGYFGYFGERGRRPGQGLLQLRRSAPGTSSCSTATARNGRLRARVRRRSTGCGPTCAAHPTAVHAGLLAPPPLQLGPAARQQHGGRGRSGRRSTSTAPTSS